MAGSFLKLKCPGCSNQQIVFTKASSDVKCMVCGKGLAESTGGKIMLNVKEFTQL